MRTFDGQPIELTASDPEADLACDSTIATPEARAGLSEALIDALVLPPTAVEGGIEVAFRPGHEDAVLRYVELESRCCSFLSLAVHSDARGGGVLTVTGRPEAQDWIRNIFSSPDGSAASEQP